MKAAVLLSFCLLLSAGLQAALPGAAPLAKLIISEFDTNADKLISTVEWQSGITESFDKLDTNGDGSIVGGEIDGMQSEIGKLTGDLAAGLVTAMIKQMIFSLDADGDANVSWKEYGASTGSLFAKLDTDSNGSLTPAELETLPTLLLTSPAKSNP